MRRQPHHGMSRLDPCGALARELIDEELAGMAEAFDYAQRETSTRKAGRGKKGRGRPNALVC